jgi:formylglycine-generating enzyme required for sulfatase activity
MRIAVFVLAAAVSHAGAAAWVAAGEPPKTETPKTEPPKTEQPKADPPKTESPKTEPSKTETPKKEDVKKESEQKEITNSIGMKLLLVPAGDFVMGSPVTEKGRNTDEGPPRTVRITRPFHIGATAVTKDQFAAFAKDANFKTHAEKEGRAWTADGGKLGEKAGASWKTPGFAQAGDHPVIDVTWNDAKAFCAWLSKKEGKTYRLPTEAEREYAARAGTSTRYGFGDDEADLSKHGNYCDTSNTNGLPWQDKQRDDGFDKTAPAGSFKPNAWGIYGMHGNVWEWCQDWYDEDYYKTGPAANPPGPVTGARRVLRGGSWISNSASCRSASRTGLGPIMRTNYIGFRIVLVSSPGT